MLVESLIFYIICSYFFRLSSVFYEIMLYFVINIFYSAWSVNLFLMPSCISPNLNFALGLEEFKKYRYPASSLMKIISIISTNENINIEIKYIIKRHLFKSINYFQFTDFRSRSKNWLFGSYLSTLLLMLGSQLKPMIILWKV